jgi:hypothetical protein
MFYKAVCSKLQGYQCAQYQIGEVTEFASTNSVNWSYYTDSLGTALHYLPRGGKVLVVEPVGDVEEGEACGNVRHKGRVWLTNKLKIIRELTGFEVWKIAKLEKIPPAVLSAAVDVPYQYWLEHIDKVTYNDIEHLDRRRKFTKTHREILGTLLYINNQDK